MKQGLGYGMIAAVAVAALKLGTLSAPLPTASVEGVNRPLPANVGIRQQLVQSSRASATPYADGCVAFDPDDGSRQYPQDTSRGAAKAIVDRFFAVPEREGTSRALRGLPTVHYAIALAPDPVHTNLGLMFDRLAVVIQQAAQDEGYTYDSSWLPWQTELTTPLLADQQFASALNDHREACPGILLFRRSISVSNTPADARSSDLVDSQYAQGLVVLVVGEQPTGGVNPSQWNNAMAWLRANASPTEVDGPVTPQPRLLRVLGPNFSGSFVSLARILANMGEESRAGDASADVHRPAPADTKDSRNQLRKSQAVFPNKDTMVRLLSGKVSGCTSVLWFEQKLARVAPFGRFVFGTTSDNDEYRIFRFLGYLNGQGTDPRDTAIVSEDETAYAFELPSGDADSRGQCEYPYAVDQRPLRLFFPRDISAMRYAYAKQSIFTLPSNEVHASHPILQSEGSAAALEPGAAADTIATYSGEMSAIAQEAVLYGIVSTMRVHHTRYIVLRCTNPLDMLFLTRFFHRAYPEARVVTMGADLLFRREIDTTEFRGTLALSNYPLIPRNQHWAELTGKPVPRAHAHRIFESNAEGDYLAARYLFDDGAKLRGLQSSGSPTAIQTSQPQNRSLVLFWKENIPEFADPYWLRDKGDPVTTTAPTWLSVVGRDGYWPLAVFNEEARLQKPLGDPSTADPPKQTIAGRARGVARRSQTDRKVLDLPTPWKIAMMLVALLLAYQVIGLWRGNVLTSSGLFALFRPIPARSQEVLQGVQSALLVAMIVALCSVGLMVPLHHDIPLGTTFRSVGPLGLVALTGIALLLLILVFRRRLVAATVLVVLSGFALGLLFALGRKLQPSNCVPFFYRGVHLTSGASPLLPVLFLLAGLWLWTWQALAGNALLCDGRPELPGAEDHIDPRPIRIWQYWRMDWYYRLLGLQCSSSTQDTACVSRSMYRLSERMARRIVKVASPLCVDPHILALPLAAVLAAFYLFHKEAPLATLEGLVFTRLLNAAFLLSFCLTIAETARMYYTWVELRRLLVALNRYRLRRTLEGLRAFGGSTLWSVSGNVQRVQLQLFMQQLDAARRLNRLFPLDSLARVLASGEAFSARSAERITQGPRWDFPVSRPAAASSFSSAPAKDLVEVTVRNDLKYAVAEVLTYVLTRRWKEETGSVHLSTPPSMAARNGDSGEQVVSGKDTGTDSMTSAAEEFVCLHYIAFIQNILARMRTMTLSMIFLFVSVCLAISFYPFVPRTQVGTWLMLDFIVIAAAVIYVYAGMERDETLSLITNTHPGALGSEFYFKTFGFLIGPLLGLLATEFPAFSESLLRWLQPGIDLVH